MSTVTESRGVQYSAEAAGTHGALRCHVTRCTTDDERGARFAVFVSNDSSDDAHALAFAFFDAPGARRRTIVQTIIGPHSDFSTSVRLDCTAAGHMPEVHVALSNGDTEFTLVVPRAHADVALPAPRAADPAFGAASDAAAAEVTAAALALRSGSAIPVAPAHAAAPVATAASLASDTRPGPRRITATAAQTPAAPRIGPMLVLFAALIGLAIYLVARPQIPELHVPPTAAAGGSLAVTYRATGVGTADYAVLGPDGEPIGQGALVIGAGLFSVNLPAASALQTYLVRLRVANALGAAVAEAYVHVPAAAAAAPAPAASAALRPAAVPPPPPPPQIRSLAVDRATVAGGETLTVYYDVAGAGGSVVLLDPAAQITYGRQPLSPAGHSAFVAPRVDTTRFLTVVTTVKRGKASVESRIGVTVTPPVSADDAAPADTGLAPQVDDAAAGGRAAAGSAVLAAPARVRSGEPVWVDLRGGGGGDVEIVLLDNSGRELDRRELTSGKRSVEFTAPEVGEATRLVFEATVPQGVGTVTLVRAISVTP